MHGAEIFGEHDGFALRPLTSERDIEYGAELIWAPILEREPTSIVRSDLTRAGLRRARDGRDETLAVINVDGRMQGLIWWSLRGSPASRLVYVNEVALAADARGHGLGSRVFALLSEWGLAHRARTMCLDYLVNNPRVASFYERLGFRHIGGDWRKPARVAPLQANPNGARAFDVERDFEVLAERIAQQRSLHRFEVVEPTLSQVRETLAPVRAGREQVSIARDALGRDSSYVWYRLDRSRLNGAPMLDVRALGSLHGTLEPSAALAALHAAELHGRAVAGNLETFLTVWEPAPALTQALAQVGFALSRIKLQRVLKGS